MPVNIGDTAIAAGSAYVGDAAVAVYVGDTLILDRSSAPPPPFGPSSFTAPSGRTTVGVVGHYTAGQSGLGFRTTIFANGVGTAHVDCESPSGAAVDRIRGRQNSGFENVAGGSESNPLRRFHVEFNANHEMQTTWQIHLLDEDLNMITMERSGGTYGGYTLASTGDLRWQNNDSPYLGDALRDWLNAVFTNEKEFVVAITTPSS